MHPKVNDFLSKATRWQHELQLLRSIILDCGLHEDYKWRVPCYTHQTANVLLINGFKEFCVLGFFKGALLSNTQRMLSQQGANTQSARVLKFSSLHEIRQHEAIIKAYIFEAIEIEKAGLKVETKTLDEYEMPEELKAKLNEKPALKAAFEALTPGRQKAYILHFAEAKQSKTRTARIEKYIPRILQGKGLNDCICGLSKRKPNCDGSHKQLGE